MDTSPEIRELDDPLGASLEDSETESRSLAAPNPESLVPRWLAILVLVLLLAVVLVGGFVIRGLITRDQRPLSPQEIEVRTWTARVAANPSDPKTHLGLGYAYQSDGRYDKALNEYAIVLKSNPRDTAALFNRGNVYFKLGVDDRAEASMWEVLKVEPTHELAAKSLGDYYARKKQYKSLIVAVKPAADAHPELADLQYLLGLANEKLGDPAAAARYYQLAIKYSPDLVAAQEGLKRVGNGK
jgi:tetratricopeptide (TPR) repeat protein